MLRFPGAVCVSLILVSPLWANPGVEWVVRSDGFPGTRAGSTPSTQLLSARGPRLRILDPAQARVVYLDLESERWIEGLPQDQSYAVTPFAEVRARRDRELANRARTRAQLIRRRARLVDRDDPAAVRALDREAARAGIRLDGEPDHVRLERFPQDDRAATLIVDGRPRQVTLQRYQIRVNQAAQPACELWVTADLELPLDLLTFYRAAGLFHPGVAARLDEIPGVVVEAVVRLQQGALAREVSTEVLRVRTQPTVRDADLTPPTAWRERAAEPDPAVERCASCGVELAPGAPRYGFEGRSYCSSAHRQAAVR